MVFIVCLGGVLGFLLWEKWRHKRNIAAVPLRIHVHGTRGKSSVTRNIARLLRNNGLRTVAKTTGDRPELILPDGTVRRWRRWGPARVQEHVALAQVASRLGAEALVVECHALGAETIHVAGRMLEATHTVITNCRPDHQETMGETEADVARTLAMVLSPGKPLFATTEAGFETLAQEAALRGCRLVAIETQPDLPTAAENDCIVAAIAAEFGFSAPAESPVSEGSRWQCIPDTPHRLLDLFSANDLMSSTRLVTAASVDAAPLPWVALLASRPDRPLRTKVFARWLADEAQFRIVIPVGWHAWYARRLTPKAKQLNLYLPPNPKPSVLLTALSAKFPQGCNIVGLGNSHGFGELFRKQLFRPRMGSHAD